MHKINWLTELAGLIVLTLGLSSCGLEKSQSQNNRAEPWGLAEPHVVRKSGDHVKFTVADMTFKNLGLSDKIVFSNIQDHVTLTVQTTCRNQDSQLPVFATTGPLKTEYSVYNLLPTAALFNPKLVLNQDLRCEFSFTATDGSGSTDHFKITFIPVDTSSPGPFFPLYLNGQRLSRKEKNWIVVNSEQSSSYLLGEPSKGVKSAELLCEFQQAHVDLNPSERFHLDGFQTALTTENTARRPNQFCRIFLLDQKLAVQNMSDLFIWKNRAPDLRVQNIASPSGRAMNTAYRITNLGSSPVTISMARGDAQPLDAVALKVLGFQTYSWNTFKILLRTTGSSPAINETANEVRYKIMAAGSVDIDFGPPAVNISCIPVHTVTGFFIKAPDENGLVLQVIDNDTPLSSAPKDFVQSDIISEIRLQYERRWQGASLAAPVAFETLTSQNHEGFGCNVFY